MANIPPEVKTRIDEAATAAEKFTKLYYDQVDGKKLSISRLYMDMATYVYNGNGFRGKEAIEKFIKDLPTTKHELSTIDAQPILEDAAGTTILIQVSGTVRIAGQKSKAFQQSFTITADNKNWKIVTDTFRLQDGICGEVKVIN